MKIIKKILKITVFVLLGILIMFDYFPYKSAVRLNNIPKNKGPYFICEQILTTGPPWAIIGDENGLYKDGRFEPVFIEGADPESILDICIKYDSSSYKYIIYGEIISEKEFGDGEMYPVITSADFDILAPIERGRSLRRYAPEDYLTLLDFKPTEWFRLIF